ncbi:putative bifunctional diguanylate cyclase/phosphodiesterase [Histidinibacterium aquaticum]|uniref:EAL domain-containing protein n=1 Tax=Histidinibacterium aquaticum TaxID=2613962 RepID=A0A5J5GS29_9RHOB|nr:EAL domain-containing protein [Histidinibacterium aquaticum]KAA9010473.1 EAL domain-containing protein [Histidinibacterium aquaticum]
MSKLPKPASAERPEFDGLRQSAIEALIIDAGSGRIDVASRGYCALTGHEAEWLEGRALSKTMPDLGKGAGLEELRRISAAPGSLETLETRVLRSDGSPVIYQVTLEASERPGLLFAFCRSATELKQARDDARTARDRLLTAIDALPDGFVLYDAQDRLVVCNDRYKELYAESAEAIVPGATFEEILRHGLVHGQYPEALGREDDWLAERLAAHRLAETEVEQQLPGNRWLRILERRTPDGGRVGLRIDITQNKTRERELRQAADTDPLTGLLNRRGLTARLEEIAAARDHCERLAVHHIDLDKFKSVNDMLGHDAGDAVLIHAARVLRRQTRSADIVARVGGDEFVVVCRDAGPEAELSDFATRLVEELSRPIRFNGKTCHVGASIGIAISGPGPGPGETHCHETPLLDADIALKHAKEGGRGRHVIFRPGMRDAARAAAQLSHEIKTGLDRQEFRIWLQPQFDITGDRVTGFEALMRWHHPERGLLGPDEFLLAAETARLIDSIDSEVLRLACTAARSLRGAGIGEPRVSVNLSTMRLSDPRLLDQISWHLQCAGLAPQNLVLEILESTLLDERVANVVENVHRLSNAGFSIELDDFGTGHAAIANLRRFPVDRVKIDRSLVAGLDRDEELRIITTSILALCRGLGIEVLCEGVQTEGERALLEQAGCSGVQGFHFAGPMPPDDLLAWLADRQEKGRDRMAHPERAPS